MTTFLSPREAALRLSITQELLWMYTRYAPKSSENRKLPYSVEQKGFSLDELDKWIQYLQAPWASSDEKRPSIPTYIQDYLKVECGGQCALCGVGHKLENAHIVPYEETRNHFHHNLIRICTDCHSKYDDGIIPREEIQRQKDRLTSRIREKLLSETSQQRFFAINAPIIDTFFVGRSKEKQTLVEYLSENRPIIVYGVGGIGKTQLVLNVLQEHQSQHIVWVNLETISTIPEIEATLARGISPERLTSPQLELLSVLSAFRGIIIFDGIERHLFSNWDGFIDFLSQIMENARQAKFIITSQSELIGFKPTPNLLTVEPLPQDETSTLFTQFFNENESARLTEDDKKWFVEFTGGHPLTARIIASLIQYFKDSTKVRQRIARYGTDALKTPVRTQQQRSTSLDVCLRAAYECFTHDQKRLLQYLTRFPAGCPVFRAEKWQEDSDFDLNLAELRRLDFVALGSNPILDYESLYMLNPIRKFVGSDWKNNHYEEAAEIQMEVANEMAFWASYIVFERLHSSDLNQIKWGLALAESELANFIEAMKYGILGSNSEVQHPDKYSRIVIGVGHLSTYFHLRGLPHLAMQFNVESAKAYERLGNYENAAENYDAAGSVYSDLYDLNGLEQIAHEITSLQEKSSSPLINAYGHVSLGRLAFAKKDFPAAIRNIKRGLEEVEKVKEADSDKSITILRLYAQLALAYQENRQTSSAIEYYQKAHELRHELGLIADDGVHYHQMANCYYDMHDFGRAENFYMRAAMQFAALNRDNYLTNSLSELGNLIVEHDFSETTKMNLTRELLEHGLDALYDQIQIFVSHYSRTPFSHDARSMLIRKVFTIIKLVSLSHYPDLLGAWSEKFQELLNKFMAGLEAEYPHKPNGPDFNLLPEVQIAWTLARLHGFAVLAYSVSQSNIEEVTEIVDFLFGDSYLDLSIEIENNRLRPYPWLEKWQISCVDHAD